MSPTFRRYKGYAFKIYSDEEERMHIHVVKEDSADITYLTTLCEDCIKYTRSYGVLVKEQYLMIEPRK